MKALKQISEVNLLPYQRRKLLQYDIENVSIHLAVEYLGIDIECGLIWKLPSKLSCNIESGVYNLGSRRLSPNIEQIRTKLSWLLSQVKDLCIIDSMPLDVYKLSRWGSKRVCHDAVYSALNKVYSASQATNYYGYKLHASCSLSGIFQSVDRSTASEHDTYYLKDIKAQIESCTLITRMGYLSAEYELILFETCKIKLDAPIRSKQKIYREQPFIYRQSRKRIETLFSQLCDQYKVRKNYAKSFEGFKKKILSKISALTIVQYIN